MMKVVDGENAILGRVAANIAKLALRGEEVTLVNAEKVVISGKLDYLIGKYAHRRTMKDKANPERSPKWPRRPDMFVRRIIRGMLPYDKSRGRAAYHRIGVEMGFPKELADAEKVSFPGVDAAKLDTKYHTVAVLCSRLGYKG